MATYLLTWNPERWPWKTLDTDIATLRRQGYLDGTWSCGATRKIVKGDRVFLMKQGKGKRGIIGAGWATSDVYEDEHWDPEQRAAGRTALCIDVRFDVILDPEDLFPREALNTGVYANMFWDPRASGTTIPDDVAVQLEEDWAQYAH